MHFKSAILLIAAMMAFCSPSQAVAKKKAPTNIFERTLLFRGGDAGSKFYRIPAIATAPDGSIVVLADKRWESINDLPWHIDVVSRRSTDLGKTWSDAVTVAGQGTNEGFGDPAIVVDKKRKQVLCIMTHGSGLWDATYEKHAYISVARSFDNGVTWSEPLDITNQLYGSKCADEKRSKWITAFATSGAAVQLSDGRIMFALVVREKESSRLTIYSVYSDDGGYTWSVSDNSACPDADESKIVELNDGKLLMSIRNRKRGAHLYSVSSNRGKSWGKCYEQPQVIEPACNGDIIRYNYGDKNVLLQTIPNHPTRREDVSIFVSFDEGKTWPLKRVLCPYESAYSSIAQLKDGTLGVFTEEWSDEDQGYQLWFTRVSPDWLFSQLPESNR
jgi:sialidase-1